MGWHFLNTERQKGKNQLRILYTSKFSYEFYLHKNYTYFKEKKLRKSTASRETCTKNKTKQNNLNIQKRFCGV